jgi:hypothetical protein
MTMAESYFTPPQDYVAEKVKTAGIFFDPIETREKRNAEYERQRAQSMENPIRACAARKLVAGELIEGERVSGDLVSGELIEGETEAAKDPLIGC